MAHRPVTAKPFPMETEGTTDIDFRKMTIGTMHGGFKVVVCLWCGKNALKMGDDYYVHKGREYRHRRKVFLIEAKVCTLITVIEKLRNKAEWSISALKNMDLTHGHFMESYDRGLVLLKTLRTEIGSILRKIRDSGPPSPKRKGNMKSEGTPK